MGGYWHKDRHLPEELDPVTRHPLAHALPLGLYAEDKVAFNRLITDPGIERLNVERHPLAPGELASIGGIRVYLATPEQAAWLRMHETKERPAPKEPDEGPLLKLAKWMQRGAEMAVHGRPVTPAPYRLPPGLNRAARRASAARGRRA